MARVRRSGRGHPAFAVYAVDPGGKTGTAKGVFTKQATMAATLRGHVVEADEWFGDPILQAQLIVEDYLVWRDEATRNGVQRIELVLERFHLRQMAVELSPVEITAAMRAMLLLSNIDVDVYQEPSDAMTFAPHQRLKTWGLYKYGRGSDHKRDALRHLALRVSVIIDER